MDNKNNDLSDVSLIIATYNEEESIDFVLENNLSNFLVIIKSTFNLLSKFTF